jgi:hypothetical protein
MSTPISITFSRTRSTPWLASEIEDRVNRLCAICDDVQSCRVVVDIPHRRHRRGNRFSIRIELAVPGEDLAVTRDANVHASVKDSDEAAWRKQFDVEAMHRDIRLVLTDAFTAARRQLRDYSQVRRRDVKRHGEPVRAAR